MYLRILQMTAIALLLGMAGTIVWASGSGSVLTAIVDIGGTPWGLVTLMDLFIGLAIVAVWIAVTERSRLSACLWISGLLVLGNLTTLAFIAWRARRGCLRHLLTGSDQ